MNVALFVYVELKEFASRGSVRVLGDLEDIVMIVAEWIRPEFVKA